MPWVGIDAGQLLASYDVPSFTWSKADTEQQLGIRRKLT
jgi:hypothetical protein